MKLHSFIVFLTLTSLCSSLSHPGPDLSTQKVQICSELCFQFALASYVEFVSDLPTNRPITRARKWDQCGSGVDLFEIKKL